MVVHEGGHLGDGGGCVGRGAHGAVVLPSLTPLGFILHPLSLQSRLHLQDTETQALKGRSQSQTPPAAVDSWRLRDRREKMKTGTTCTRESVYTSNITENKKRLKCRLKDSLKCDFEVLYLFISIFCNVIIPIHWILEAKAHKSHTWVIFIFIFIIFR